MGKRYILSLVTGLITALYCLIQYQEELKFIKLQEEQREISAQTISEIKLLVPENTVISKFTLWNLKIKDPSEFKNLSGIEGSAIQEFALEKFGNIEAIYSIRNKEYRWEFHGIIQKNNNLQAVFYNPALNEKRTRVLKKGEKLEPNINIEELKESSALIKYRLSDKEIQKFELKVFYEELKRYLKKGVKR